MKIVIEESDGNRVIDFKPVFELLNDELSGINQSLVLVCAGGYVLQLHGYRATADVDAFYKSSVEIEKIIRKVGDRFGMNTPDELWLNASIANMNPEPPNRCCDSVYRFSNLEVKAVNITYLIGMKLISAREQDARDVFNILKRDGPKEPLELMSELVDMGFDVDISVLLDVFGRAYGMDWLDHYYKSNESELRKYY